MVERPSLHLQSPVLQNAKVTSVMSRSIAPFKALGLQHSPHPVRQADEVVAPEAMQGMYERASDMEALESAQSQSECAELIAENRYQCGSIAPPVVASCEPRAPLVVRRYERIG